MCKSRPLPLATPLRSPKQRRATLAARVLPRASCRVSPPLCTFGASSGPRRLSFSRLTTRAPPRPRATPSLSSDPRFASSSLSLSSDPRFASSSLSRPRVLFEFAHLEYSFLEFAFSRELLISSKVTSRVTSRGRTERRGGGGGGGGGGGESLIEREKVKRRSRKRLRRRPLGCATARQWRSTVRKAERLTLAAR